MSAGKHTEGEWRVEAGTTLVWGACNADDPSTRGMGYPIAECRITPAGRWAEGPDASEGEANARLIAAALDMLAAGRRVLDYAVLDRMLVDPAHDDNCAFGIRLGDLRALAAALAKAEGRADA